MNTINNFLDQVIVVRVINFSILTVILIITIINARRVNRLLKRVETALSDTGRALEESNEAKRISTSLLEVANGRRNP